MRRITVLAVICSVVFVASPAFGFHEENEPVGSCPSADWTMLEEGVDYVAFIDDPSNQPPRVSGEPVRIEQWMDSKGNDDGFVCRKDTSGTRVVVDNSGSL